MWVLSTPLEALPLRYSCLSVVLLSAVLSLAAPPPVQAGFLLPSGLQPGDQFQIVFVTSDAIQGTSSDISTYNAFVTSEASPITNYLTSLGYTGITWSAIASTETANAIDNAPNSQTSTTPWANWCPIRQTASICTPRTATNS